MSEGPLVLVERRDHVVVISMQREPKRNAVNRALADALDDALNALDDDPDAWVGVLTGTPIVFSAGSDLTAGGDYYTERGGEYGLIRRNRRKPLIAAVEGPALGGGMELVLSCDLVVAASSATFGLPEVSRGLLPTCAGLFRGPQILPVNLAREMVLGGAPITAERGFQAGFINVVSEPGEALEQAIALADRICQNAPTSVQASLAAMNEVLRAQDDLGWKATDEAKQKIMTCEDTREGITAFLEKRAPKWIGR